MLLVIYITMFISAFLLAKAIVSQLDGYHARARLGIIRSEKVPNALVMNITRPFWKAIAPYLSRFKLLRIRNALDKMLIKAGMENILAVEDLWAYQLVTAILFPLLWMIVPTVPHDIYTSFASMIAGFLFPIVWLKGAINKRRTEIVTELPTAVDLITLSVEAGLDFMAALARVAEGAKNSPLVDEFRRLVDEMKLGASRSEALKGLAERLQIPSISSFSSLLIQADKLGASVGPVLRAQSEKMRSDRFQRAERAGAAAAQKLLFPLVFCIMPAVFIVIFGPIIVQLVTNGFRGLF